MTPERLEEIRQRLAKITPGRWSNTEEVFPEVRASGGELIADCTLLADARFIADAPDIIRELLGDLTEAQTENERLKAALRLFADHIQKLKVQSPGLDLPYGAMLAVDYLIEAARVLVGSKDEHS